MHYKFSYITSLAFDILIFKLTNNISSNMLNSYIGYFKAPNKLIYLLGSLREFQSNDLFDFDEKYQEER
jgi:hypothetical protein